jgi:flagellar motor protein MotB
MSAKGKGSGEEGGGHSVGLWYVSFSDMITLLLSFFVILTTFSSFDSGSQKRFRGVIRSIANYSIFPSHEGLKDSFLPGMEGQVDRTEFGSEAPTDSEPKETWQPRKIPWVASADAYRDRKSFYIPSAQMFWGRGSRLTPNGEAVLERIAQFVAKVPCQVIIREVVPDGSKDLEARLERAWSLRSYFSERAKLPREWFNISATGTAGGQAQRSVGEPMMEVRLEARSQ